MTQPADTDERLQRAVAAISRGLGPVRFRYPTGSCPVFAVGDEHVVKLFAPEGREHWGTEREVLGYLGGAPGVPAPELHTAGELDAELDGWLYIVMERLPGEPLRQAWERIPAPERVRLATELGRVMAALHALPTEPLAAVRSGFDVFLNQQRQGCVAAQARHGLDAYWLEQIPGFLAGVALAAASPVLLHTEIMREHVLVGEHDGAWRITGLIDFEPAMIGHPEYELASVGLFVSEGDPAVLGAVLAGYGMPAPDARLAERCMAYALLHRYSKLTWYLDRMPPRTRNPTLRDLAMQWWPHG